MMMQFRKTVGICFWILMSAGLLTITSAVAEGQVVSSRVSSTTPGTAFRVDGVEYRQAQTFLWQIGSKHVLEAIIGQTDSTATTIYTFTSWGDASGLFSATTPTVTITASATITDYIAAMGTAYRIDLSFFDLPADPTRTTVCAYPGTNNQPLNSPGIQFPGIVYVAGTCYDSSRKIYLAANTTITLAAYPNPGFVFKGWTLTNSTSNDFITSFVLTGPTILVPRFAPGKQITFFTDPFELRVQVDRQAIATSDPGASYLTRPAGVMDFPEGTSIVLGAPSPQMDIKGRTWVFDSFDIGGGQNTVYKITDVNIRSTITARFKRGVAASLLTNPTNLKLSVDGRDSWPSYNFTWAVDSTHTIVAPSETTDGKGRKYKFMGWVHGGDAQQTLTMPSDPAASVRWVANYQLIPRLTVTSSQAGIRLQVDGADCTSPCTVDKVAGTDVAISVPALVSLGEATRADFNTWSDGITAAGRTIKIGADDLRVSAAYRTMNRLVVFADPGEGAAVRFQPASPDGFYSPETQVAITVEANNGFRFRRWDGDLQGSVKTASMSMFSPRSARALLDKVAFIEPTGVRNAAGVTPIDAVAAGSVISVYGSSLSLDTLAGGSSPAAQTLGGVSVRWNDRLLPLIFVSPAQINAVLPGDIPEGNQTLFVKLPSQLEIQAPFTVARNAPGLFATYVDSRGFAVAVHEDGKVISAESPAKRGETITIFGTGFGPYLRPVPEGFAVPDLPVYKLADSVELFAGEFSAAATTTTAAVSMIGTVASRFRIVPEFPSGPAIELRVRVNGQESNKVLLPVE